MTTHRDIEPALERYFEEGPQVLPDRVLEAALADIDHTTQRLGWRRPWRFLFMPTFQKLAIAGVAVIAFALVGSTFLTRPAPNVVGTPSPTVGPATGPTPVRFTLESDAGDIGVRFDLPAGWYSFEDANVSAFEPEGPDSLWPLIGVDVLLVDDVYADTCEGRALSEPRLGPGVDDLIAWIRARPGLMVGEPRPLSVAGHEGVEIEVDSGHPPGCEDVPVWPSGLPLGSHREGPYLIRRAMEYRVIALDVDGRRVVLVVNGMRGTFEARLDDAQVVLDSLELEVR